MARNQQTSSCSDMLLYFIAIFLPPLPVFIKRGCSAQFFLNVLLTIIIWLPGVIHAWFIISRTQNVRQQPQYIHAGYQQPQGYGAPPPPPPRQSQQAQYGYAPPPGQPAKKY